MIQAKSLLSRFKMYFSINAILPLFSLPVFDLQ